MIQIFGTKKCRSTQKALRFFKDRGIEIQFRDIAEKGMSAGELDSVARLVGGIDKLIDLEGEAAKTKGLSYMDFDAREELILNPLLLRTPVLRVGKEKASVGLNEEKWKDYC